MVKISEIARTSTFAWSSDSLPLLATGTVAGAVDANFNSSSLLEVWDTFPATEKGKPIFSAPVDHRFYALAWSKPFEGRPQGLLAGAFEDGSVEFWDAETLIKSKDLAKASVHKSHKHSGPVKSLQFNPLQDHVLVTGGAKGEIFIWDTKKFSEPFAPGVAMTPMDEVTSVSWNNSVSHIFASTGTGGYTSIWDLKSKREVLHLSYNGPTGRANFSHVAWHPTQSTKLVTASDSDSCPVILTWDLRNSNAPEQVLEGHKKGVLSLDWCKQDPELLISSGKDNTTFLWNPIQNKKLGEYPTTANWAFQTKFAPAAPDIFATASFDGKIIVQSLQDTSPPVLNKVSSNDDNVFWNQISTTETQQPIFEVQQAPQWLKRPSSVSFGFGSKLVLIKKDVSGKSIINIQKFISKGSTSSSASFEALKSSDYETLINNKVASTFVNESDKYDWEMLEKLSKSGKSEIFKQEISDTLPKKKESEAKKTESIDGAIAPEADDSFFANLGNGKTTTEDDEFKPSGSFKIFSDKASDSHKDLIKLVLNNKVGEAVSTCLEQGKLAEAFILALDSSDDVKQKVKNAYFKKNKNDQLARVLYNVSSKNISDIAENADVSNWKEIAAGIVAYTTDQSDFDAKITALGDRVLASNAKNQRDIAIKCYLAGNALDKIANIWLQELPAFETELLKSDNASGISSPADARLESLSNFVEKIATYRSICKITDIISGPSIEPISKTILEYTNIVAGFGEFELAEKFLQLLPAELAGIEKERIAKATGVFKAPVVATPVTATRTGTGRTSAYGRANIAPVVTPQPSLNKAFVPTPLPMPTGPNAPKTFVPSPLPPVHNAVPASNPYARAMGASNPYAPQTGQNSYNGSAPAPQVVSPPPLASAQSLKKDTEGWNDLPETFKPKAAPRRAVAGATISPAATSNPAMFQSNTAPGKKTFSAPPAVGPPKVGSRTPSQTLVPQQAIQSPRDSPATLNKRYAPPPVVNDPLQNGLNTPPIGGGFSIPQTTGSPALPPKKNPYAPSASSNPPFSPGSTPNHSQFARPPVSQGASFSAPSNTRTQSFPAPPPPKNPYAPSASVSSTQGIPKSGIAPPPPFGSTAAMPTQPGFNSIPPPPTGYAPPPGANSAGYAPPPQAGFGVPPPPPGANSANSAPPPPPAVPETKYPKGDRSHIPEKSEPIYSSLTKVHEAIKPNIPERYARHGQDMNQRLGFLFDHLNNDDLLSDESIGLLTKLSSALEARDFATASALNVEIATNHSDELGDWHTGVKRLITMAEAMY